MRWSAVGDCIQWLIDQFRRPGDLEHPPPTIPVSTTAGSTTCAVTLSLTRSRAGIPDGAYG
jgi:hypothetical protein